MLESVLKVLRGRGAARRSQPAQVAERIGETQTFVSKCERRERRIDVIELGTFCRAFGVSLIGKGPIYFPKISLSLVFATCSVRFRH